MESESQKLKTGHRLDVGTRFARRIDCRSRDDYYDYKDYTGVCLLLLTLLFRRRRRVRGVLWEPGWEEGWEKQRRGKGEDEDVRSGSKPKARRR